MPQMAPFHRRPTEQKHLATAFHGLAYVAAADNHRLLESLRRSGVLMQVNASFFEGWFHRRKALSMFRKGEFQLLGSDCHNLDARKPNWASVPEDVKQSVSRNSRKLLKQYQL